MSKLRWQIIVVLLALVAIGILLLSQQPISTSSPQEGDKPVAGGIYTEALVGSFGRLNPVLDFYNSTDHDIDRLIFSGLITHDARGVPQSDLAETWGISQDGKFIVSPSALMPNFTMGHLCAAYCGAWPNQDADQESAATGAGLGS